MPEPIFSNIVVDLFIKGGPIMWPILLATLAAVAAVGERILWWARFNKRRDRARLGEVFAAVQAGDVALALKKCHGTDDPAVKVVEAGLAAYPGGVEEAMQIVATDEVENAAKFLPVMDTLITLAPLLGLLGTVTGIMGSFSAVGGSELAVEKVTGGIGEALIATAAGLGIAICVLLPYNWCNRRSSDLSMELHKVGSHIEGLMKRVNPTASLGHSSPISEESK